MVRTALAIAVFALAVDVLAVTPVRSDDRLDIPAEITPRAVISNLVGICRAGGNYVAVGDDGHILLSADKGKNWVQSSVPVSSPLVACNFPTPQKGWAVGHDGVILHTEDGGKHWERQLDGRKVGDVMVTYYEKREQSGDTKIDKALDEARRFQREGPSKPFMDVYFENEQSGWAIGSFNMILKTADGGKTWEPWLDRTENDNAYSLHALAVADGELFIVGELGLVRRLNRQQNRFVTVKSPYVGSFFGLIGKPGVIFIYGLSGNVFSSRDKGKSWRSLRHDMGAALVGGTFLDDGRLVLVSNAGHVLVSNDKGNALTQTRNTEEMLSAVAPVDRNSVILAGIRGVRLQSLK
ncbi:MAG: YCF48-related protein [Sterolibacterium sp.]